MRQPPSPGRPGGPARPPGPPRNLSASPAMLRLCVAARSSSSNRRLQLRTNHGTANRGMASRRRLQLPSPWQRRWRGSRPTWPAAASRKEAWAGGGPVGCGPRRRWHGRWQQGLRARRRRRRRGAEADLDLLRRADARAGRPAPNHQRPLARRGRRPRGACPGGGPPAGRLAAGRGEVGIRWARGEGGVYGRGLEARNGDKQRAAAGKAEPQARHPAQLPRVPPRATPRAQPRRRQPAAPAGVRVSIESLRRTVTPAWRTCTLPQQRA
jgi:hypothetical protein